MAKKKLGYTWYPKDFASDPDVMLMTAAERGIYRDLIDLAYQTNNCIKYSFDALARYTNGTEVEVKKVLQMKGKEDGDHWRIPSCDKRLKIIKRNSQNGMKNKNSVAPVVAPVLINNTSMSDGSGNFFKIGLDLFKYPVSKYITENMPQFLEIWEVQNKPLKRNEVLALMDKQYVGHDFTNENHIKNSFKLVGKSMLKNKPGAELTPQKSGINYGKK